MGKNTAALECCWRSAALCEVPINAQVTYQATTVAVLTVREPRERTAMTKLPVGFLMRDRIGNLIAGRSLIRLR